MQQAFLQDLAKEHNIFCWDFDKTLIQGKNSLIFRKFISDHSDKEHHIISFRDSEAGLIDYLVERMGYEEGLIKSVVTLPLELVHGFYKWNGRGMEWALKAIENGCGHQFSPSNEATAFEIVEAVEKAYEFKALATKSLGSRILFDDYYDELLPFFKRHDLCLVDSLGDISG